MRSSQVQLQKRLEAEVGYHHGYGRGAEYGEPAWTSVQERDIAAFVRSGKRMFYHCGYDWSFLHPVVTMTLAEGGHLLVMPEDFGGLEGDVLVATSGGSGYTPVKVTGDARYRRNEWPDTTGIPRVCSIEHRKPGPGQHQRVELEFFPAADQDYTVQLTYYVAKDFEVESAPFLYGGAEHFETLLAACKAAGERDGDDLTDGPQQLYFQQRLAISMDVDRRSKPQHLGYNGDPGVWRHAWHWRRRNPGEGNTVTFAGVTPE